MGDLERGWAILAGQGHGGAVVIMIAGVIAALGVAIGMWFAMRAARRRNREDMTPLQRTLPRSFDRTLPRSFDEKLRP